MPHTISEITRRAIIDHFTTTRTSWSGRLQEDEFLGRLYDLSTMPSTDHRLRGAGADIRQHRVNWNDWSDDWVFYDPRFNILHAPDEEFLRFLCETVHPVVRPDTEVAEVLVDDFNRELAADGWKLVEIMKISGKPVFGTQHGDFREDIFEEPTGWTKVDRQLQEMKLRLDTAQNEEQFQAVGLLGRECLISVAQEIYDENLHVTLDGVKPSETDAKRMLEAILDQELGGSANEEARAHARAAIRLALALQHKRTADFKTAALCAEACTSIVNIMAIVSGRREK